MSLAARCPACGTVFRVVQDQLRVSEGWVRCGRCTEVFNAIESLVDVDAVGSAPPTSSVRTGSARVMEDLEQTMAGDSPPGEAVDDGHWPSSLPPAAEGKPETAGEAASFARSGIVEVSPEPIVAEPDVRADPPSLPAFVRQADRAARWRRPGVRALLSAMAILAGTALAAQVLLTYRDIVAARWAPMAPVLAAACRWLNCGIDAPRSIESLAVESSGLVRIDGTPLYRLSVALRNRAGFAVATPAVDLSVTDNQGGLIARRVIVPSDLGTAPLKVPPQADVVLQATLGNGDRPISGYTIELFYP